MSFRVINKTIAGFALLVSLSIQAADPAESGFTPVEKFGCISDLTPVREFFVGNLADNLQGTLEVARSETGGVYPEGSVIQLVPTEVMVKHSAGYNAATKDWEFVELNVSAEGTTIRGQGFTDVVNRFGGNCFACHVKAKPEWDMVCEKGHGCDPIPLTAAMIRAIQKTDPRCESVELTPEEAAGLKALSQATPPA